jgi:molybdenum cofactor biosynthesis enzyme MoaA
VKLEQNILWLCEFKDIINLKISLDTLNVHDYKRITKTKNNTSFNNVLGGIDAALTSGFSVGLNAVIANQDFSGIVDLLNFAEQKRLDIKLLTISTFCGNVEMMTNQPLLKKTIDYLNEHYQSNGEVRLFGNRGIAMLAYKLGEDNVIRVVDHSSANSYTPNKIYFSFCMECSFFPCDSGAMSISLCTDGELLPCRGRVDYMQNLDIKNADEIESRFLQVLNLYNNCIEVNVNELQTNLSILPS